MERVKNGPVSFDKFEWDDFSLEAKDLVKGMLSYDITLRHSASSAFQHPWIQKNQTLVISLLNQPNHLKVNKVLTNLRNFRVF